MVQSVEYNVISASRKLSPLPNIDQELEKLALIMKDNLFSFCYDLILMNLHFQVDMRVIKFVINNMYHQVALNYQNKKKKKKKKKKIHQEHFNQFS